MHFRKVLLLKMLKGAHPNSKPLNDALFETFCEKEADTARSIPKFIKKSLGMVRRDANEIRKRNGDEELKDIVSEDRVKPLIKI